MIAITFIFTSLVLYNLVRDFLHPAFFLFFFFTVGYILLEIVPGYYSVKIESSFVIYLYLLIFSSFSLLTTLIFKNKNEVVDFRKNKINNFILNKNIFNFIYIILFIGLFIYIYRYLHLIFSYSSLSEYYYEMRKASLTGDYLIKNNSFYANTLSFSSVFTLLLFYRILTEKVSSIYKLIFVIFLILVSVAQTIDGARSTISLIFISLLYIFIFHKGLFSSIKGVLIFLLVLFILSISTRNVTQGNILETFFYFLKHIILYAYGSLISFDYFLNNYFFIESNFFSRMTAKLNYYLDIFNIAIIQKPLNPLMNYIYISSEQRTNIYTCFATYISYFGFHGTALVMVFNSFIITYIYLKRYNYIYFFLYSLIFATLCLSSLKEFFFLSFPYCLRLVFILIFVSKLNFFLKFLKISLRNYIKV